MTIRLPPAVEDLLDNCLFDFEHLEIALHLRSNSSRGWTAAELAAALPMPEELLIQALSGLHSDGLIAIAEGTSVRYRYAPSSKELEAAMADLAVIYRDERVAVVSRMSLNAINRMKLRTLRAFSDAFVMSKDQKGDKGGKGG